MSAREEDEIRAYVLSQTPPDSDDEVELVQKVGQRRVAGRDHDLYDVHMSGGARWWVITDMTNLYSQDNFPSLDQAFTYHLGLNLVLQEQFKVEPTPELAERLPKSWRLYTGAVEAMVGATESEDFQAVGIRCRETLLAVVKENMDAEWIKITGDKPQTANAKAWFGIMANSLTLNSKPRAYLKDLADKVWDLSVWLQHYADAAEVHAELVLGATQQLLRAFNLLRIQHDQQHDRCPQCDSYQVVEESSELIERDGHFGTLLHDECVACGWQSEPSFDQWPRDRLQRLVDYHSGAWNPRKRSMEELDVRSQAKSLDSEPPRQSNQQDF